MKKQLYAAAVALSCLCGAKADSNFFVYDDDVTDRWWGADTNIVAAHRAFETAHRLEEGRTAQFFSRALESELARPGGGDSNTVALALDVLAWSGDMSVTGALNRALFDTNNPYRAQTFYACVIAAQSDPTELARDVTLRVPARERDTWYRSAISNCPISYLKQNPGMSESLERNPLIRKAPGRPDLIRANLRLRNYFYEASVFETDPECAWTLYMLAFKNSGDITEADIELTMNWGYSEAERLSVWRGPRPFKEKKKEEEDDEEWEEPEDEDDIPEDEDDMTKKKRSLEKRFAGTPGQIGENFSLEIEYEACKEYERSFIKKRKINEDFFIRVPKEDSIPLVIEKFAGLMREKPPFSDGHSLEAHHLRIRETLETLENFCDTNLLEVQEHVIATIPNEHGYRVPSNWAPKKRNTYGLYDESLSQEEAITLLKEKIAGLIREPVSFIDGYLEHEYTITITLRALQEAGEFTNAEITEIIRPLVPEKKLFLIRKRWRPSQPSAGADTAAPQPEKTEATK